MGEMPHYPGFFILGFAFANIKVQYKGLFASLKLSPEEADSANMDKAMVPQRTIYSGCKGVRASRNRPHRG
jgi:hypothetical protein